MNKDKLSKIQIAGDEYSKHFKDIAWDIVMDEVGETDDENRKTIAMFTARDMAIGALIKRKEYLLTGVGIGVVGTALTVGIYSKIKKRRNTKKGNSSKTLEGVEINTFEPEVMTINGEGKVVKRISNKNRESLASIIDEINENGNSVKH